MEYILSELKSKMSKPSYDTWLSNSAVQSFSNDLLTIIVENEFIRNWLDRRYTKIINNLLYEKTGAELKVKFVTPEDYTEPEEEGNEIKTEQPPQQDTVNKLNPKYTFDSFVVGAANRFAHMLSSSCSHSLRNHINPLFIYGGVDLENTFNAGG